MLENKFFLSRVVKSLPNFRSIPSTDTCLEAVLAEDLVEEVEDLELHARDLVVLLRALDLRLVDHLIHAAALPQLVLRGLGRRKGKEGAQREQQLHGSTPTELFEFQLYPCGGWGRRRLHDDCCQWVGHQAIYTETPAVVPSDVRRVAEHPSTAPPTSIRPPIFFSFSMVFDYRGLAPRA